MKNIFDKPEQEEVLHRLEKLTPLSRALWGKMDVAQMLAHCAGALQFPTEDLKPEIGPIIYLGMLFKRSILGSKPLGKNSPTTKEIRITDKRDFQVEKENFLKAFHKLTKAGEAGVSAKTHPFLGKIQKRDWGRINYKHIDHHFSQFGA